MKNDRVMLKLSGEALAGPQGGYNDDEIIRVARQVKEAYVNGTQIGIVIGGGNYWRGRTSTNIDRSKSDSIGMLATVMNCIYVSELFRSEGMKTAILSPFICGTMTEQYSKDLAVRYFEEGKILFFAGGTGHPFFSTDTGIMLRSAELDVDMIFMAKNIDGVYDKDPGKNPDAKRFDKISIDDVISHNLKVIDLTASSMAKEYKLPIAIFDLKEKDSIISALRGKINGTIITVD